MREIIYPEEYLAIIEMAAKRGFTKKSAEEQGIGVHAHHIIPKSVAPELANEKSNIVFLTYKEHYNVHKILAEANPKDKIAIAFKRMCTKKDTKEFCTEEDYNKAMILFRDNMSGDNAPSKRLDVRNKMSANHANVSGCNNPNYGKHWSPEVIAKMSEGHKGNKSNLGRPKPEGAGTPPKKIICIEHPEIEFKSQTYAAIKTKELGWTGVSPIHISESIRGKRNYCGKDVDGNKLHWKEVI